MNDPFVNLSGGVTPNRITKNTAGEMKWSDVHKEVIGYSSDTPLPSAENGKRAKVVIQTKEEWRKEQREIRLRKVKKR